MCRALPLSPLHCSRRWEEEEEEEEEEEAQGGKASNPSAGCRCSRRAAVGTPKLHASHPEPRVARPWEEKGEEEEQEEEEEKEEEEEEEKEEEDEEQEKEEEAQRPAPLPSSSKRLPCQRASNLPTLLSNLVSNHLGDQALHDADTRALGTHEIQQLAVVQPARLTGR